MEDDFDEVDGLEPSAEEVAATSGFGALPPETQAEIRKLRKADQKHREERGTLQKELLTARYGEEVVELIPPEVTDYARQTELAERFQARLAVTSSTEAQASVAEAEAAEEPPTPQEQQLATAIGGPATGTSSLPTDVSAKEILAIGRKDPAKADELIRAKDFSQERSLEDYR